jgi:uncharacterized protein (DUF983 family)
MCAMKDNKKPALLASIIGNRCPRCRQGHLFVDKNPYHLKKTVTMPEHCEVCGQKFELETGFYFGTGYVSYALTIIVTIITFTIWALTLGISIMDNSIFYWLGTNAGVVLLLQPILQRLSRSIWIAFFVRYEDAIKHKVNQV